MPRDPFQPSLIGMKSAGTHKTGYNSSTKRDVDIRRDMHAITLFPGGNIIFPGAADYLHRESTAPTLPKNESQDHCSPKRKYPGWIGRSIVASLSTFQQTRSSTVNVGKCRHQKQTHDQQYPTNLRSH